MECRQMINLKTCPCTYPSCPRKGICCLCLKHHLANQELPACFFDAATEKTYDRSFKKFCQSQN